jgi:hypothetical protein
VRCESIFIGSTLSRFDLYDYGPILPSQNITQGSFGVAVRVEQSLSVAGEVDHRDRACNLHHHYRPVVVANSNQSFSERAVSFTGVWTVCSSFDFRPLQLRKTSFVTVGNIRRLFTTRLSTVDKTDCCLFATSSRRFYVGWRCPVCAKSYFVHDKRFVSIGQLPTDYRAATKYMALSRPSQDQLT